MMNRPEFLDVISPAHVCLVPAKTPLSSQAMETHGWDARATSDFPGRFLE